MTQVAQYQLKTAEETLLAADATKVVVAAPGANKSIVIINLFVEVIVSAAQACDVEDGSGVEELVKLPATPGLIQRQLWFTRGYKLPANQSLRIQPAAAAPSVHVVVEYYIDGV